MTLHHERFEIRNEVRSLTSFRFLAAFYVFLFHVQIRTSVFGDGLLGGAIAEGAVGMTMFFCLSGFILSHAYAGMKINVRSYFTNRIARLYPVYFLAAILALPWLVKEFYSEAATTPLAYALVALCILLVFGFLLIQAWLPQTFVFWNNSASWSISVEAFFYSLFPSLRDPIFNLNTKALIFVFALLCLISSMIAASQIVFQDSPDSFPLFYALPFFRLPEFVAGIVAYSLMLRLKWTSGLRNLLLFVLFLGVLHVVLLGPVLPGYTLHNWILIPAVSAALVLLLKAEVNGSKLLVGRVMVWLGQISYCFYSFQFHVLEGLRFMMPPTLNEGSIFLIAAFILLLVISAFAHHWVEEPARIWIRKRAKKVQQLKGSLS
jgi:peptidoglycan/LPS O-acetylase OafA/YrhL